MANFMSVNGRSINVGSGKNVTMNGDKIFIDGKRVDLDGLSDGKVFNIVISGSVDTVEGDFASITVEGGAGSVRTVNGDVEVQGAVSGKVSTVSGNVTVKGSVGGKVSTVSGHIKR